MKLIELTESTGFILMISPSTPLGIEPRVLLYQVSFTLEFLDLKLFLVVCV